MGEITTVLNRNQCSIDLEKNSRGVTYSVKVYGDSPEELDTLLQAYMAIAKKRALELEKQ
jgi:hypothetical protein